jgi:cobyrinic acid a,c-diamide synthase
MAAALPVVFAFDAKPQACGYTVLETVQPNPFYAVGDSLRGHEFHYTYMQSSAVKNLTFAFHVRRGHGFDVALQWRQLSGENGAARTITSSREAVSGAHCG